MGIFEELAYEGENLLVHYNYFRARVNAQKFRVETSRCLK